MMTVVVGAYTASAMSVFFAAFGLYPTSPVSAVPTGVVPFVLYFLSSAVLPAIVEELVFRGAIMQSLRRFGDTFALFVSSLLFGLVHGNLVRLPWPLSPACHRLFCPAHRSLRTGMAIHFVNNALAVVLSAISASFSINGQQTITSIVYVV